MVANSTEKASGLPKEPINEVIDALRSLALEDHITIGECELLRQVANILEQNKFKIELAS